MSHHIYTTPGFVLDSRPNGEAGKLLYIFTRDLGLIAAVAQGVRLDSSKLRYHTQDFSYNSFSLVRGKEMWRLTGALSPPGESLSIPSPSSQLLYVRVLALLRRLLSGEEKNELLFNILRAFTEFLQVTELDSEKIALAECIVVVRILHALGYIGDVPELKQFFIEEKTGGKTRGNNSSKNSKKPHPKWEESLLEQMKPVKPIAIREINAGLKASQL